MTTLERLVADARQAVGETTQVGPTGAGKKRYELFHGANSLCSQKVRAVLAEHETGYVAHNLDMFAGLTYLPAFVRLRMAGCEAMGLPLMTTHDGSTSVTSGGCDPAVVPVLIDWAEDRIVLDSKGICLDLDRAVPDGSHLVPDHLVDEIEAELVIVDDLPNYQMLIGTPPGEDTRPASRRGPDAGDIARRKVDRCDGYIAQFADDPVLLKAYRAKRAKELMAAERLFTSKSMAAAYARTETAVRDLDGRLGGRNAPYLFGEVVTLADIFWGVELLRLRNLGADTFWSDRKAPSVATYLTRLEALPSMRSAILDWPGALY